MIREFNFDGLIGPTHNYAGLSFGNIASAKHQNQTAFPRAAALQGLAKMKALADLGIGQAILPPLRRPRLEFLRSLGFRGNNRQLIDQAYNANPALLAACYSASNMWTANAATVSPSIDCADGRLHITTANLSSTLHRSIEHPSTHRILRCIFADENFFAVHPALPSQPGLSDEGAANHTRLGKPGFLSDQPGIELFTYGVDNLNKNASPTKFPARQTRLASESIARIHQLAPDAVCFLQQAPTAIDAGVFHNDVISVGHQNVLLCHEFSFCDQSTQLAALQNAFQRKLNQPLIVVEFSDQELPLADAVASYLFNSQLVTRPDGGITIVCPLEVEEIATAYRCIQRLLADENPIDDVLFLDLRQSMNNGGGPACLRLRVAMNQRQQQATHQEVFFNDTLVDQLTQWVQKHYRAELNIEDLRDPLLIDEVLSAFESLAQILGLPLDALADFPATV